MSPPAESCAECRTKTAVLVVFARLDGRGVAKLCAKCARELLACVSGRPIESGVAL